MFHVNASGIPYAAAVTRCKLVLPGPALGGKSVADLINGEGVTLAAGVPTVWQSLLRHMSKHGLRFSTLNRTVIGGAVCPRSMIEAFEVQHGVRVLHAWGMTELSPLATVARLKAGRLKLPVSKQIRIQE